MSFCCHLRVCSYHNCKNLLSVALGKLLTKCGFEYWDLGMDLDYKRRLGAELMPRSEWLNQVRRSRIENKGVTLQISGGDRKNAKELISWERTNDTTMIEAVANGVAIENGSSAKQPADYSKKESSPPPDKKESPAKQNRKRSHDDEEGEMKE